MSAEHEEALVVLTSLARDLLMETYKALREDDEFVSLAGEGVRRVRTSSGAQIYGQPIGTVITADKEESIRRQKQTAPGAAPAASPGVKSKPSLSQNRKSKIDSNVRTQAPATVAPVEPVNVSKVHTHPRVPGAKAYELSDGNVVIEDAKGVRSKPQKLDTQVLRQKGWNVQEVQNGQEDSQGSSGVGADNISSPRDQANNYEVGLRTLKSISSNASKPSSRHVDALMTFDTRGDEINSSLRTGREPGEENIKVIDSLRDMLSNSITPEPIMVYRGISFGSPQDRDRFVSEVLKPGTEFIDRGFGRSSANPDSARMHADGDIADNPGLLINIAVPEGSRAASFNAVSGKEDQDQEVLLADNATYIVKSVETDATGRTVATVTYIDPLSGKPAEERMKDAEKDTVTPEQAAAKRARRFSWNSSDIQLNTLPTGGSVDGENTESGNADRSGQASDRSSPAQQPRNNNGNNPQGSEGSGQASPASGSSRPRRRPAQGGVQS